MADDAELEGLDPFDLYDQEARRLDAHLSSLPAEAWAEPSRCQGWSVCDVVAHLASSESYNFASLDGGIAALLAGFAEQGVVDIDSFNAVGIARLVHLSTDELVAQWRADNATTRRRFRDRGRDSVDTMVGPYPARLQAFYLANELAVHADDIAVPVSDEERAHRQAWRVRFSRFALTETKPDVTVEPIGGRTRVRADAVDLSLDDDDFVEAVAGRAGEASTLGPTARALLSIEG